MSPAFRLHVPARHLLELIIADGGGGMKALFEITRFDQIPFAIGMMTPHAGKTVRLQFHAHGERIAFDFADLALEAVYFFCDPEKILHVMPDLVGNDIGLCKIAGRAKPL